MGKREWENKFKAACKERGIDPKQKVWKKNELNAVAEAMDTDISLLVRYLKYGRI